MSAKHSPGPWSVYTSPDGSKLVGIGDSNAEGVADCGFGIWRGGDAEAIANARLIAAAPDLLEALKEARTQLEQYEAVETGEDYCDLQINAAISKAEGN